MKIIFITAKPSYMPDPEELGTWQPMQDEEGFYMQTLGDYQLFVHECLRDHIYLIYYTTQIPVCKERGMC